MRFGAILEVNAQTDNRVARGEGIMVLPRGVEEKEPWFPMWSRGGEETMVSRSYMLYQWCFTVGRITHLR